MLLNDRTFRINENPSFLFHENLQRSKEKPCQDLNKLLANRGYISNSSNLLSYCLVITLLLLLQFVLSQGSYSGEGNAPMFGDYEAQRHWMEITWHLPISDWYVNTTDNNLLYWGLDYPPLTAYHSYIMGYIAHSINPSWVSLFSSRGHETPSHKMFMRMSAILPYLAIYITSLGLLSKLTSDKKISKILFFALSCLYPGLLAIDCAHFQYNSISLGFFLVAYSCFHSDYTLLGSFFFVLAVNYKQMELYHSLPIFVFILARSIKRPLIHRIRESFVQILKVGLIVLPSFAVLWVPFLLQGLQHTQQVLRRIFPFYRGLYEDKVASVWCSYSFILKLNKLLTLERQIQLSTVVVLLVSIPSLVLLFYRPTLKNFRFSLFLTSLAFFLFSFQVHEKSILLPAISAILLLADYPLEVSCFLQVTCTSMFSLCLKDNNGSLLVLFVSYSLFSFLVLKKSYGTLSIWLGVLSISLGVLLCIAEWILIPPSNLPHIFPLLNAFYSCSTFLLYLAYFYVQMLTNTFRKFLIMELRNKLSWAITNKRLNDLTPRIPYILPDAGFLVWNDGATRGQEFLKVLFGIQEKNACFPAQLRCPSDTPFAEFVTKVQRKLIQVRYPSIEKETVFDPTIHSDIDVLVSESCPDSTLEHILERNEKIKIGGFEYKVIKNSMDFNLMVSSIQLYPIVNCPLIPTLSSVKNGKTADVRPKIHWFVGDPIFISEDYTKQKKQKFRGYALGPPNDISFDDIENRTFKVENFHFRCMGQFFVPTKDDVAKQIVFIVDAGPDSVVRCGIIGDIVQDQIEKPVYENRMKWAAEKREGLRVATYNILADLYLSFKPTNTELYFPYCPILYQRPDYRYGLLLQEFMNYDADLFFMQEVDEKMEKRFLVPLFESLNMSFVFERKRRMKETSVVGEGTAIAFKQSSFREVERFSTCIANLLSENMDVNDIIKSSISSSEVFLTRPTTLQVLVIQNRDTSEFIVCGTTHLHFNPVHEHIKAVQAVLAVRKIYEIARKFERVRVVFAGDFNSLPDGPVHKLLENGYLLADDECWQNDKEIEAKDIKLLPSSNGSPLRDLIRTKAYTNYTQFKNAEGVIMGFSGILDYIWTDGFLLKRTAPDIPHDLVTKYQAIPSKIAPSDHLPIIAEFDTDDSHSQPATKNAIL
ncbi:unnamed protein product [Auanema sp. JU1783]|nr:unnamed protein product [Auanema sp. JU1783]